MILNSTGIYRHGPSPAFYPVFREREDEESTCLRLDLERVGLEELPHQVAQLLADGYPEREVAEVLGISRGKLRRLKEKLGAQLAPLRTDWGLA